MASPEKSQKLLRQTAPPGIQLMFNHNFPEDCRCPYCAVIVAVHWAIVDTTNQRLTDREGTQTESLPENWPSLIGVHGDASSRFIPLDYKNLDTGKTVTIKIQELAEGDTVALMSSAEGSKAMVVETKDCVNVQAVKDGVRNVYSVYHVDFLWTLRDRVKSKLMPNEEDARGVKGVPEGKSPYASNLTPEQEEALTRDRERKELNRLREAERERQRAEQSEFNDPLAVGGPSRSSVPNRNPYRGIGSSDLDPFSGIGDIGGVGGMLMDPRGFRRPQLPQGIVPGARFDPFGPPLGGQPPLGPRFGGGNVAPRLPFGYINPDHERVHDDYNDMFS